MPPLGRPVNPGTVLLPQRNAQVAAATDVLVVGGGPAGLGAAIGAADAGAGVILVERYGFLGGTATAAMVTPLMSFHTQQPRSQQPGATTLFPTDHGPGQPVISGVLGRLVTELVKRGGAITPSLDTGFVVPFDPEVFKIVALDLVDRAGVRFLFHALATDVVEGRETRAVVFETKSGPIVIEAKVIVDCTGDADIAARAGAPFEIGREDDGLVEPMTLMFQMAEFQRTHFEAYVRENPEQWYGVHGLWDLVRKATATGELNMAREDILFFGTPHEKVLSINSTRIINVLGTDVWDLTYAEWVGRRQMQQIARFLQCYVPGFKDSYVSQSGTNVGVRETRRVIGEYKLTADDVLGARKFEDVVAHGAYPIDIHSPKGEGTVMKKLPPGQFYDIPLRCLIPKHTEGIMVPGRSMSGTHEAQSSFRAMPICMATGQAAGVCAALAVLQRRSLRAIPVQDVQQELKRQGAILRMFS